MGRKLAEDDLLDWRGGDYGQRVGDEMSLLKPYYDCDGITIYHGYCREILPHLPKVDLVLTDPPYGSGLSTDFNKRFTHKTNGWWKNIDRTGCARHAPIIGDNETFDPSCLLSIESTAKIMWGANWYAKRLPDSGGWLVWDKRNGDRDVSAANWPMGEAELAWANMGKAIRVFRHTWFGLIRDTERGQYFHPTQKPRELLKWCIELSKTTGTILDPFMGSGTTLRAAKDLRRKAIGIEIEEKYCEIAVRRLAQEVLAL